jgi:hypothetical protein
MFNNWLRQQFGPDRKFWADLKLDIEQARSRIRLYRNQIEGKRFRRTTKRKLQAETTQSLQKILDDRDLSLVTLGATQRLDIRRYEFLREFFRLAGDPIDDARERRLLDGIAKELRRKLKKS